MKKILFTTLCASVLWASASIAEVLAPVVLPENHEFEKPGVETSAWVVSYEVVDGERERVLTSINESPTRPGDIIVYEIAVVNPTQAALENIVLDNDFPAELLLQEGSFAGPAGMVVDFVIEGDEERYALFPETEDEAERPSIASVDVLRVTMPEVPANSKVLVTYAGQVRQGNSTTTNHNQEKN